MNITLDTGTRLSLQTIADRAYRAMYAADQKFGHNSPAHRIAWTAFGEALAIRDGFKVPRVFVDRAEMTLGLDIVEALCEGRRARQGVNLEAIVAELVSRPGMAGTSDGAHCAHCKGTGRRS